MAYVMVVIDVPDEMFDFPDESPDNGQSDGYDIVRTMVNSVRNAQLTSYDVSDQATCHEMWKFGGDRITQNQR